MNRFHLPPYPEGDPQTCRWCGGPSWPDRNGRCRPCGDLEALIRIDPELTAALLSAVRSGKPYLSESLLYRDLSIRIKTDPELAETIMNAIRA